MCDPTSARRERMAHEEGRREAALEARLLSHERRLNALAKDDAVQRDILTELRAIHALLERRP